MDAAHAPRRHLGEILVQEGILSSDGLAGALEEQARTQRPLGKVLVELGLVSPGAIANALAEQHGGLLRTEYGVSAGLKSVRGPDDEEDEAAAPEPEPEPEPAPTLPTIPTQTAPVRAPEPSPDVLESWRNAVAERDTMLARLAEAVKARDAEIARLRAEAEAAPAPAPAPTPAEPDTAALEELEARLAAAVAGRDAAREALADRDAEIARLRAEAEAAPPAPEPPTEELEALRSSLRDREMELVSAGDRLAAAEEQLAKLRAETDAHAAQADRQDELEHVTAELRAREAEIAVLKLQRERDAEVAQAPPAAHEPEADQPEPEREHLLFVPRESGYELVRRDGPPPERGDRVEGYLVVRLGPSPLPGETLTCAYLAAG